MFGIKPNGKIEVIEGPMTIHFRCFNPEDYARIRFQTFLRENDNNPKPDEISIAQMTGGVSIPYALIQELHGTITAENAKTKNFNSFRPLAIYDHEEQHAIKRIFGDKIQKQTLIDEIMWAKTDEKKLLAIKRYLRFHREYLAEESVRDEILAFVMEAAYSPKEVVGFLLRPKERGGLYDYLNDEIAKNKKEFTILRDALGYQFSKKTLDEIIDNIYKDEYRTRIQNGIDACMALQDSGYSREKVVGVLIHEPLSRWKKVVKRLLANKP